MFLLLPPRQGLLSFLPWEITLFSSFLSLLPPCLPLLLSFIPSFLFSSLPSFSFSPSFPSYFISRYLSNFHQLWHYIVFWLGITLKCHISIYIYIYLWYNAFYLHQKELSWLMAGKILVCGWEEGMQRGKFVFILQDMGISEVKYSLCRPGSRWWQLQNISHFAFFDQGMHAIGPFTVTSHLYVLCLNAFIN